MSLRELIVRWGEREREAARGGKAEQSSSDAIASTETKKKSKMKKIHFLKKKNQKMFSGNFGDFQAGLLGGVAQLTKLAEDAVEGASRLKDELEASIDKGFLAAQEAASSVVVDGFEGNGNGNRDESSSPSKAVAPASGAPSARLRAKSAEKLSDAEEEESLLLLLLLLLLLMLRTERRRPL